jgi:hypothetical protein
MKEITDKFILKKYDGGCQDNDNDLKIENILINRSHNSSQGNINVTLCAVFKLSEKNKLYKIKKIEIRGAKYCSSPLKDGVLLLTESKPDYKSLQKKLKYQMTETKFKKIKEDLEEENIFYFTTDLNELKFEKKFKEGIIGKYLTLFFISKHELGGTTFDVGPMNIFGKIIDNDE